MHFFPLEPFIDWLRDQGFAVGLDRYEQVGRLLDALPEGYEAGDVRNVLAPLFAKSPEEQQRFYRLFDRYYAQYSRQKAHSQTLEPAKVGRTILQKYRHQLETQVNQRWIFILGALLSAGFLIYLLIQVFWSIKGTENRTSAGKYLAEYGLDQDHYWRHLGNYVWRDLTGQAQACDSLEGMVFSYEEKSVDANGGVFDFRPEIKLDTGWRFRWWVDDSLRSQEPFPRLTLDAKPDQWRTGHEVRLELETGYGCQSSFQRLIELSLAPTCQAQFDFDSILSRGLLVSLKASPVVADFDEIVSWEWTLAGEVLGLGPKLDYLFSNPGRYTICLAIRSAQGCEDQYCQTLDLTEEIESMDLVRLPAPPMPEPDLSPLNSSPLGAFYPLFVLIILLAGLIAYDIFKYNRSQVFKGKTRSTRGPFTWKIRLPQPPSLYSEDDIHAGSIQLRRRQDSEIQILDLPASIDATLEQGGLPHFSYRLGRRPSEYLVLIERKHARDHFATWACRLVEQWQTLDVYIEAFFCRPDLDLFEQEGRSRKFTLSELKQRFPQHRVILIGNGEGLTDAMSGVLNAHAYELMSWKERAVLTPAHPHHWSLREVTLARHFMLAPASLANWIRLPEWWELGQWPDLKHWLSEAGPLPPTESESLELGYLGVYLGPQRLRWLAACAIFPELHYDLSIQLAQHLGLALTEENLLPVLKLAAFRYGHMSDQLREDLGDLLVPEEQREIRSIVVKTLEESSPQADSFAAERHQIHLTSQRWAMQQGSWLTHRQLSEQMQELLEREEIEDAMIWDLVNQNQGGFFRFELPKNWRQRLFRKGIPLLGWRGWLKYGLMGLIILIGLFPYYRQRFAPVLEKLTLQEWLNQQQNLVRIEGEYYRLSSASDSALYFSYIGTQFYEKEDVGSAYNEFDLAMSLAPFEPLYAYQRGITLQRLQNAAQGDSLGRQAYADFSRVLALSGGVRGGQVPKFRSVFSVKEEQTSYMQAPTNGSGFLVAAGNRLVGFGVDRSRNASNSRGEYQTTRQQVFAFEAPIEAIAVHPSRENLVAVAVEGRLSLISIEDGGKGRELVLNQAAHTRPVRALKFSPDGSQLISAGDDHLALIWDLINLERLQLRHALEFIHTAEVLDAAFSSDGKMALTSSADSTVVFWDAKDGSFKQVVNFDGPVYQAKLVAGDEMLALTLGQPGQVKLYDLKTGKERLLNAREGSYLSLTTSQDEFVWGSTYKLADEEIWKFQLRSGSGGSEWGELSLEDFIPIALSRNEGVYSQAPLRSAIQPELHFKGSDWVAAIIPNQGIQVFTQDEELGSTANPYYLGATYGRGVMDLGQKRWLEASQKFRTMLSDSSLRPGWRSKAQLGLGTALLYSILQDPSLTPETRVDFFLQALEELATVVSTDSSLISSLRRLTPVLLASYQRIPFDQQLLDQVCDLVEEYQSNACNLFTYDEVKPYRMGLAAVRRGKLWGYLDSLQELVIPLQFLEAASFNPSSGLARVSPVLGKGPIPNTVSEVLIDESGEIKFGLGEFASEGIWAAYSLENGQWGYLDEETYSIRIPFEYNEAWPFYRGFAKVRQFNFFGLIDRNGRVALNGISYQRLEVKQGQPDLLIMESRKGTRTETIAYPPESLQGTGTERPPPPPLESDDGSVGETTGGGVSVLGKISSGLILAVKEGRFGFLRPPQKGGKVELVTTSQGDFEVAIDFQYASALEFSYDRAAVRRVGEQWGYIDPLGRVVIPTRLDSANHFQQIGKQVLAKVARDGASYFIDLNGQCVEAGNLICPAQPTTQKPQPSPPLNEDKTSSTATGKPYAFPQDGKWGLIGSDGQILLAPRFDQEFRFEGGTARVREAGRWGIIDEKGSMLIPTRYEQIQNFSDGLAAVRSSGQWGFFDRLGNKVIDFQFESVQPFSGGTSIVRNGKSSFRIDRQGKKIGGRVY